MNVMGLMKKVTDLNAEVEKARRMAYEEARTLENALYCEGEHRTELVRVMDYYEELSAAMERYKEVCEKLESMMKGEITGIMI